MAWGNATGREAFATLVVVLVACGGDDASVGEGTATDGSTVSATMTTSVTLTTAPTTTSDPDTSTTDDGSSSSGDDTTTGGPSCPTTHACVAVPDGWNGPVLLRESTDPKAPGECPPEYPDLAPAGGTELLAEAAECGCSCGAATGTTCALATTLHYWGTDPTCSEGTPVSSFNLFTTICNALGVNLPASSYFQVEPVLVEGGSCVAESSAAIADAIFERVASTCGGAEPLEGCDEAEVCVPQPGGESLCVWQSGDSDCPEGFEARQEVYHETIDDTRGCDECACAAPVGLCDNAAITMFANVCNPPVSGVIAATGECYPGSAISPTQSAIFAVGDPNAFCVPTDAIATGVATPTDPVTVCCAE